MQEPRQTAPFAKLSLVSVTLTVIFATITHAYDYGLGHSALIAGCIVVVICSVLNILYQRTRNKAILLFYELLNAWIIIGFGIVNGFWNHAFKVFLNFLHGGYLPPVMARLFMNPKIGSVFLECVGILTFVASMFAAYYGFKLVPGKQSTYL